jgi:peptide methionine sulfoxide reductase msrA/msrB
MKLVPKFLLIIALISLNACAQNKEGAVESSSNTKIFKTDQEWKDILSPEKFYVLRKEGTEKPYSGKLLMNKEKGVYKCAACGNELFTDEMKFDAHCGWPSFDKEIEGGKIITKDDYSLGMKRTEIECAKCGGHLGHLFDDGPTDTGLRYCVNSVSLEFVNEKDIQKTDTITLGAGCFWCVEGVFELIGGVEEVKSGYAGGSVKNPSYKEVCTGNTGHAEVVQVVFNPSIISLEDILKVFFTAHDPTTLNRQGADVGTQYRSVIFYHNEAQKTTAKHIVELLTTEKAFELPIVTQIKPLTNFHIAENYHQDYYELNKSEPYCRMVILPKIEKIEKIFSEQLK